MSDLLYAPQIVSLNRFACKRILCSGRSWQQINVLRYSDLVNSKHASGGGTTAVSPSAHTFRRSVWFVVLVAFVLRLAVITIGHTYRITPRRDHFQFGWEMGRLARSIAQGHGFSSPTDLDSGPSAWTAPVYPYILGGIFKAFGVYSAASAWMILTFNSIFAALTCWTVFRIAERIFGNTVARWSAWIWAVFPYLIYWPVRVVWEASFSTFLLTLGLWMAIRIADATSTKRLHWICFGLLWGLIALTNTALIILLPFLIGWMLFLQKSRPAEVGGAVICLTVFLLCLVPWTIRNYGTFGRFILIRDNLSLELYEANNQASSGLWTRSEHPGNDPATMRRFQELGEIRFMDEKKNQLHEFIREHPAEFLKFTAERAWYFWAAPPQATVVHGYDFRIARHAQFFLAALFSFAGLALMFLRRNPYRWLLAPFLLIYPLPYYLVNPFPRYKHPVEPVMLLLIVFVISEAQSVKLRLQL
jgi:4-amino-4-deoxy-L-arabinose transferase-like glycosyltransferase